MTSPRILVGSVLILLVVAVAAGWWLTRDQRAVAPHQSSADLRLDDSRRPNVETSTPASVPGEGLVPVREAVNPGAVDPARVALGGTVVVLDAAGVQQAVGEGSFVLQLRHGERLESRRVAVVDGKWRTQESAATIFNVANLKIDEQPVRLSTGYAPIPEDRTIAIRGRAVPRTILRVLGEGSGTDLSRVEIRADEGFSSSVPVGDSHPIVVHDVSSPVTLPWPTHLWEQRTFWVRAAGHAWESVIVNERSGGNFQVHLEPQGADLDVHLHNYVPESGAMVKLFLVRNQSVASARPSPQGQVQFRGLKAHRHRIRVEVDRTGATPVVLAEGQADLRGTSRVSMTLDLSHASAVIDERLHGTLYLPEGWRPLEGSLILSRRGRWQPPIRIRSTAMEPIDQTLFRWDAGPQGPGTFVASVPRYGFAQIVKVTEAGASPIQIPPPTLVRLRAVDTDQGREVILDDAQWYSAVSPESNLTNARTVARGPSERELSFRATTGPIVLHVLQAGFKGHRREIHLSPGHNDITLRLTPVANFRLVTRVGSHNVLLPDLKERLRVEQIGGPGRVISMRQEIDSWRIQVNQPGHYAVRLLAEPEYQPAAKVEVTIGFREVADVEVELVRATPR
jgi:hypothetical protein